MDEFNQFGPGFPIPSKMVFVKNPIFTFWIDLVFPDKIIDFLMDKISFE